MRQFAGRVDTRRLARAVRGGLATAALVLGTLGIAHAQPAGPDLTIGKTHIGNFSASQPDATFTLQVSNTGGAPTVGTVTVTDALPASLTPVSASGAGWTCLITGNAATCSRSDALVAGASYPSITLVAVVSATPPAAITNTATVSGGGDTNLANNTALDIANVGFAVADLAITKTDGVTSVAPGGSVTYTLVASNAGPSNASGALVVDTLPALLTGVTWTCLGAGGGTCTAAGNGNINQSVNLPPGGSVTYTVTATVSLSASGTLSNTATVSPPAGAADPNPGNNRATDTDTIVQSADLAITKTDGVSSVAAGGNLTYTIVASNAGPSSASGATVADTLPASLSGASWTCVGADGGTCTAAGSGNLSDTVNLPPGASVTYTVTATVSPSASGTLSNTATVSTPAGLSDPNPGNNSATDTDTLAQGGDLALTLTGTAGPVAPGNPVAYTLTATNTGPASASGVAITSVFPAPLTGVQWTCVATGGASCAASGSNAVADTVVLPAGGSVVYSVSATVAANASVASVTSSASLTPPAGFADASAANNTASAVTGIQLAPVAVPTLTPWGLAVLALGVVGALGLGRRPERG